MSYLIFRPLDNKTSRSRLTLALLEFLPDVLATACTRVLHHSLHEGGTEGCEA